MGKLRVFESIGRKTYQMMEALRTSAAAQQMPAAANRINAARKYVAPNRTRRASSIQTYGISGATRVRFEQERRNVRYAKQGTAAQVY